MDYVVILGCDSPLMSPETACFAESIGLVPAICFKAFVVGEQGALGAGGIIRPLAKRGAIGDSAGPVEPALYFSPEAGLRTDGDGAAI